MVLKAGRSNHVVPGGSGAEHLGLGLRVQPQQEQGRKHLTALEDF